MYVIRHKVSVGLLAVCLCTAAIAGMSEDKKPAQGEALQNWLDGLVFEKTAVDNESRALAPTSEITYPDELKGKTIQLQVVQSGTKRDTDKSKLKSGKSVSLPRLFPAFDTAKDKALIPLSLGGLELVAKQGSFTASRELVGVRHHLQLTRIEQEPIGPLLFKSWENRLSFATPLRCERYKATLGELRFFVGTNSMALSIEAFDERFGSDQAEWPETTAAELYVSTIGSTNINQVILRPGAKDPHKRVTVVSNHKKVAEHSFLYGTRPLHGKKGYCMIAVVSLGSLGLDGETTEFEFEAAFNVQAEGWDKPAFATMFHSDHAYQSDEHYAHITIQRFTD